MDSSGFPRLSVGGALTVIAQCGRTVRVAYQPDIARTTAARHRSTFQEGARTRRLMDGEYRLALYV
jgi:hypothetical protein